MNRGGAEDSSPHPDPPRRRRVATDVPIPGAVGAGAAFCVGTALVALRWLIGIQLGGPGLVLMCAAVAWIVGARLAATSHENSHWGKMMSGAMEPRSITVGAEGLFGMWAISIDGQAPIPAALYDDADTKIIVDTANLCMASPLRLRRMPRVSVDLWRPDVKARQREHMREYHQRPEVKARRRERQQQPDVKVRQRQHRAG